VLTRPRSRVKNRRELNASLQGTTLGESDDVDDTIKWIRRNKKKAKELARKRQEELENLDKSYQGEDYTESTLQQHHLGRKLTPTAEDLAGLKVSHDFEALNEGEDRILTLKDSRILDNEGE
jgi:U4/U6.U5 tri-snRNP-associated protein 1